MLKSKMTMCLGLVLMALIVMPLSAQSLTPAQKKIQDDILKNLGKPPAKLKGMNIVIGNYWADYDTTKTPPTAQWKNSSSDNLTLNWRKKIQSDFGFKMQDKMVASWNEMPQIAMTSIMAKRPAADVFVLQSDWAMTLYRQGLLYPISDSKGIELSTKNKVVEVNQMINQLFNLPDPSKPSSRKTYAFQIGYGGSLHGQVIFFNKRLFREAGLSENEPYDLQKKNEWTWPKFLEICQKLTRDTNNDGIPDTYATTADLSTEILDIFVAGNNSEYVRKDAKTGKLVNNTSAPEFLEALNFAIQLQNARVMMPKPQGAAWDWYKPMFNDGRVAMRLEQEYVRQDIANMTDDWGMVLPPKGPRAKEYVVFTDENVMVIPNTKTKEEVEAILWAVQAWNAPLETRWQDALRQVFRDDRVVEETMKIIRDPKNQKFRNHILVPGLNRGGIAWEMWYYEGTAQQLVETVSQSWNNLIMDANGE